MTGVELYPAPTEGEILDIVRQKIGVSEEGEVLNDVSVGGVLTLLEVEFEGKKPGEKIQFIYRKAGMAPGGINRYTTSIEVWYFQDGKVVSGKSKVIATYNKDSGEWKMES